MDAWQVELHYGKGRILCQISDAPLNTLITNLKEKFKNV